MKILIIGGGIAGYNCAKRIQENSADFQVTVVEKQREPFRKYLLARWLIDKVEDKDFFIDWRNLESKVEFINDKAERINLNRKIVYLKEGHPQDFDKLVLATGLEAEQLEFNGARKKGVCYLANSISIRQVKDEIKRSKHILVYTSSMFGLELVSSLTRFPDKVINLAYNSTLRFIHDSQGLALKEYLSAKKVGLYANANIEEVFGEGRIRAAKLSQNKILASDLLLIDSSLRPSFPEISPEASWHTQPRSLLLKRDIFFACGDVINTSAERSSFFFLNRLQAQRQALEVVSMLCP